MDDLRRNAEGYYDPTAYKAILNAEKESAKMKRGEIWEVDYRGTYKCAVVVAVQEKFCNVLVLNDEMSTEFDVKVKAIGMKYTHPAMLSYKFNDGFASFIRKMEDDEFESLLSCIAGSLDFPQDCSTCNMEMEAMQVQTLEKELQDVQKMYVDLLAENERLKAQPANGPDSTEIIVLKTQCDMYKQQYEQLLERMIGR